jgi:hypothetical protein
LALTVHLPHGEHVVRWGDVYRGPTLANALPRSNSNCVASTVNGILRVYRPHISLVSPFAGQLLILSPARPHFAPEGD